MNALLLLFLSLSVSGSVLVLVLLLLKPLLKNRLSHTWQYYIWLIVILRLLLPFSPETSGIASAVHYFQAIGSSPSASPAPPPPDSGDRQEPVTIPQPSAATAPETPRSDLREQNAAIPWRELSGYAWALWLTAALVLFVHKAASYRSFVRFVRVGAKRVTDPRLLTLYGEVLAEAGVRRRLPLFINEQVSSPMLVGMLRPMVILPPLQAGDGAFRNIFRHELTHYRRRDFFYKWLVQIAVCLHWFNPLVYLAAREISRACELSCDEAVLRRLDAADRLTYGDALITSLQAQGGYSDFVVSITMSESARLVKERLEAIVNHREQKKWMAALAAVLAVGLFAGGYALGVYSVMPPDEKTKDALLQQEYSLYIFTARELMAQAHTVFSWYFSDAPFEELWIAEDAPTLELDGAYYRKVVRFQSLDELRSATEAVFTRAFCQSNFYDKIEIGKFREIDGALYVGDQGGVPEGGTTPPKEYIVLSTSKENVALTAICEGPDKNSDNPSNVPLVDYSFELLLRKEGPQNPDTSPADSWRVASYYNYNEGGYQGDLLPFVEDVQEDGMSKDGYGLTVYVNGEYLSSDVRYLWNNVNNIYNVDNTETFEVSDSGVSLFEDAPEFFEIFNYDEAVDAYFTADGKAQLEQTLIGGPYTFIQKRGQKVYRMGPWRTGYSYADALDGMKVVEAVGDTVVLDIKYRQPEGTNDPPTFGHAEFTIKRMDGNWYVEDYDYPEAVNETHNAAPDSESALESSGSANVPAGFAWQAVTFPANDIGKTQYSGKVFDIAPFTLELLLPDGWTLKTPEAEGDAAWGLFSTVGIYQGEVRIGSMGCNTFQLYEDAGDNPRAVYSQIMTGSVVSWEEDYTPVVQSEAACTATCRIRRQVPKDGQAMAAAKTQYSRGILSYDKNLLVYVGIQLEEGVIADKSLWAIAKSVKLT